MSVNLKHNLLGVILLFPYCLLSSINPTPYSFSNDFKIWRWGGGRAWGLLVLHTHMGSGGWVRDEFGQVSAKQFKSPLEFSWLWSNSSGEGRSRVGVVRRPAVDESNGCRAKQKGHPLPQGCRTARSSSAEGRIRGAPLPQHFCSFQPIPSPCIPSHAGHVKCRPFPSSLLFPFSLTLASCNKQPCLFLIISSVSHPASLLFSEGLCLKSLHLPLFTVTSVTLMPQPFSNPSPLAPPFIFSASRLSSSLSFLFV